MVCLRNGVRVCENLPVALWFTGIVRDCVAHPPAFGGVVIVRVSSDRLHLTDVAASLVSRSMTTRLSLSYLRGSVLLIAERA